MLTVRVPEQVHRARDPLPAPGRDAPAARRGSNQRRLALQKKVLITIPHKVLVHIYTVRVMFCIHFQIVLYQSNVIFTKKALNLL